MARKFPPKYAPRKAKIEAQAKAEAERQARAESALLLSDGAPRWAIEAIDEADLEPYEKMYAQMLAIAAPALMLICQDTGKALDALAAADVVAHTQKAKRVQA